MDARLYRLYFNRIEDAPQIWSIDEGTVATEINVCGMEIEVRTVSGYNLDAEYPEPKAWLEACGVLEIVGGLAVIR